MSRWVQFYFPVHMMKVLCCTIVLSCDISIGENEPKCGPYLIPLSARATTNNTHSATKACLSALYARSASWNAAIHQLQASWIAPRAHLQYGMDLRVAPEPQQAIYQCPHECWR